MLHILVVFWWSEPDGRRWQHSSARAEKAEGYLSLSGFVGVLDGGEGDPPWHSQLLQGPHAACTAPATGGGDAACQNPLNSGWLRWILNLLNPHQPPQDRKCRQVEDRLSSSSPCIKLSALPLISGVHQFTRCSKMQNEIITSSCGQIHCEWLKFVQSRSGVQTTVSMQHELRLQLWVRWFAAFRVWDRAL